MKKKLSVSSPPEQLVTIRQEDIVITDKMLADIKSRRGKEPDLTDPELPDDFDWSRAVRGKFYRPRKQQVTIRLDMDVLNWFMQAAEQYQTLINTVCRDYMIAHQKPITKKKKRAR